MFSTGSLLLIIYLIGMARNTPIEEIRTLVLTAGIIFELSFIYVCRSKLPLREIGAFSNRWLNVSVVVGLILHLLLLYTPLAYAFKVVPLNIGHWIFILPFALSGLIAFEAWKIWKSRK